MSRIDRDGEIVNSGKPKRGRLAHADCVRLRAIWAFRLRLEGLTDPQIAQLMRFSAKHVNHLINSLPAEYRSGIRARRLRASRADALLQESEDEDARWHGG